MNKKYLILLSGLFYLSMSGCSKTDEMAANTIPEVKIVKVHEEYVPFKKKLIGQTVTEEQIDLKARITGYLEKVNFKWGSIVKKGQTLFIIEKTQYEADLKKAEAELENCMAVQTNSEKDYNRKKGLYFKNAVSEEDYDNARMKKETADADVKNAEAKVTEAKLNLSYTLIKAPFTGKIDKPKYTAGNLVGPDSGTLATIIKLNPIQVEFSPNEALYLAKNPGEREKKSIKVEIKLSDNKMYKYSGEITYIDNKVDSSTGTINFRATFPNPDNYLLPGQYVDVILEKKVEGNSLVIPQKCVMSGQIGEYVYVVDKKNIVHTRKIITDGEFGLNIVVTNGLKQGEKVIVSGMQNSANGKKVKVVPEK